MIPRRIAEHVKSHDWFAVVIDFVRIAGSDTPPDDVWQSALQSGIADLIHPSLLFDLGFYYSEQAAIGVKYVRTEATARAQ